MKTYNASFYIKHGFAVAPICDPFSKMQYGLMKALEKTGILPDDIEFNSKYFRAVIRLEIEASNNYEANKKVSEVAKSLESYDGQSHERTFLVEKYSVEEAK